MARYIKERDRLCKTCNIVKQYSEFDTFTTAAGHVRVRLQCQECLDPDAPRTCKSCHVSKTLSEFIVHRKKERATYISQQCRGCRWDRVRRHPSIVSARDQARADRASKRRAKIDAVVEQKPKPPGWTPPPSAEQLGMWYRDMVTRPEVIALRARIDDSEFEETG